MNEKGAIIDAQTIFSKYRGNAAPVNSNAEV